MDLVGTDELIRVLSQRLAGLKLRKHDLQKEVDFKTLILAKLTSNTVQEQEEEEEFGEDCKDLFTNKRVAPSQAIQSLLDEFGFDLVAFCKSLTGDHLAMARTVNYIRTQALNGVSPPVVIQFVQANQDQWQQNEVYLKPVLNNDSLLWGDSFSDDEDFDGEDVGEEDEDDDNSVVSSSSSSSSKTSVDSYFGGYDNIDIHEEMLHDELRTLAYRDSFIHSRDLVFKNKLVIDVGSGTGILSMLCSQYGEARTVYAIENCRTLSQISRKLMHCNGFHEDKIQLFVGLAQEFAIKHPQVKVDAIVSEWMGYALLYEHQMLSAVLQVRDQTLIQGGRMFPNKSRLLIHAMGDSDTRLNYWDDVYGLDFSLMKELRRARVDVMVVNPQALTSPVAVFKEFDFETMMDSELDFEAEFEVVPTKEVMEGLCISFDCSFPADAPGLASLTTSPEFPPTHWKQSVLWLDEPLRVEPGQPVRGVVSFIRKGPSRLDIGLKLTHPVQVLSIYEM
ncbi:hypothetical protein BASA82_000627 [Batrachochytrium salamandrivorans]|nr:hypothetical protein BASA81_004180 [Batrachochytrium salamandrivorans]KAH9262308.1 hypothetical protein BASA82_000627 [Batrachochytrium salamandrivorans]